MPNLLVLVYTLMQNILIITWKHIKDSMQKDETNMPTVK